MNIIVLADQHPKLACRWDHYYRTIAAGHLLNEPIPEIKFTDSPGGVGHKMLAKCMDLISRRETAWSAFQRFVEWLAWGSAVSSERPEISEETQEALYRTFNLEPLLSEPHDYLGTMLAESKGNGWNPHAFFPTPHVIVELMVQMTLTSSRSEATALRKDARLQTVLDPAVGTGRMLLHASNFTYCLFGCDIDPLVAMIARLNGVWFAPWMAFPLPADILGVPLPPPPHAELPVPTEYLPSQGTPLYRCDDRGQGLLF